MMRMGPLRWFIPGLVLLSFRFVAIATGAEEKQSLEADLLIVGGNESACAAAVQAARLGVRRIVLVNDIDWLGGQFSAEGVGPVDERTTLHGKSANFPRSGLFLEMIERIRAHNTRTYGVAAPGNCWSATETIEPAAAARLFEEFLAPYTDKGSGQIRIQRGWQASRVALTGQRVTGVVFERANKPAERLVVMARLTMDSSDWGDVIRLSGARYSAGPDLRARFGEPSAPERFETGGHQKMNPITWAITLREAGRDARIPQPSNYDDRAFANPGRLWVDSDMSTGIYSQAGLSIYTQRRLVDRRHFGFPRGTEKVQLNSTLQDYPLCQLPQRVVDALEASERGASRKNIAAMTPAQRQIIFDDAKQHALKFLHYLQTKAHDQAEDCPQSFRYMELSGEFGTADRLPPKPYVREGLRLEALCMLREHDIRAATQEPHWARFMPDDAVFGFQFHIDFHPTRREYLDGGRDGAWRPVHTASRNWHTNTDRAMFPLRGLVSVNRDGLLGASKNIGVSSMVQAALRLHGQMMLCGQASATVAWVCLRDGVEPRAVAADARRVREIQRTLVRGRSGPGVLLWPYHDLPPKHPAFEAANLMSVAGIWCPDSNTVSFEPDKPVSSAEWRAIIERVPASSLQALVGKLPTTRAEAVCALASAVDFDRLPVRHTIAARNDVPPPTIGLDGKVLSQLRRQPPTDSLAMLRSKAEKRLTEPLVAVTDKKVASPSGNSHDYVSLGRYWWPNPKTASGLPYVQRDGEVNPENDAYDRHRFERMTEAVEQLSLAWFLTGETRYAERAARQLRVWFLDDATRMTPHLKHAQLIKGINDGRGVGLIDVRGLTSAVDSEALLRGAGAWRAEDHERLTAWFRDYFKWLTTSKHGQDEAAAGNNHGTWYDVQAATIALFIGDTASARRICEGARARRIAKQIEPDGRQPRELRRTLSFGYTLFNLDGLFRLARLGEHVGVDLWHCRTDDGRSIRAALDWVLPYATGRKQWDHKQIGKQNFRPLVRLLRQAARVYKEPAYEKDIEQLPDTGDELLWVNLFHPRL